MFRIQKTDVGTLREHGAWLLDNYDNVRVLGNRKYLHIADNLVYIIYYENGNVDGIQLVGRDGCEVLLVA